MRTNSRKQQCYLQLVRWIIQTTFTVSLLLKFFCVQERTFIDLDANGMLWMIFWGTFWCQSLKISVSTTLNWNFCGGGSTDPQVFFWTQVRAGRLGKSQHSTDAYHLNRTPCLYKFYNLLAPGGQCVVRIYRIIDVFGSAKSQEQQKEERRRWGKSTSYSDHLKKQQSVVKI